MIPRHPRSTLFPYTTLFRSKPLFNYPQKVRDFLDDSAHRARVGALKYLVELREPDATHDLFLRLRRSEEHTSELQSRFDLVCRLLLEKKKNSHLLYSIC